MSKKDACSWRNWRSMLEYLESLGLEVKEVWVTKKTHRRIRVASRATRQEAILTAPSGHGREDARAELNWKSQVARVARNLSAKKDESIDRESAVKSSAARLPLLVTLPASCTA